MANYFELNLNLESAAGLKSNTIHDVIFEGVESKVVGKDTEYKVLEFKFKKEGVGTHRHTIFAPKTDADLKRKVTSISGKDVTSPSNLEQAMELVRQLIAAVNPEFYSELKSKDSAVAKKAAAKWSPTNWDSMCVQLAKLVNPKIGAELQIKLISNTKGEGQIPGFPLGINSNTGGVYSSTTVFGKEISFTKKELEKIEKAVAPTPSRVSSENQFTMPEIPSVTTDEVNTALPEDDNDLPF